MDANEGRLPTNIAFYTEGEIFSIPGYKPHFQSPHPKNYSDTKS
jgi:hypothetical protein